MFKAIFKFPDTASPRWARLRMTDLKECDHSDIFPLICLNLEFSFDFLCNILQLCFYHVLSLWVSLLHAETFTAPSLETDRTSQAICSYLQGRAKQAMIFILFDSWFRPLHGYTLRRRRISSWAQLCVKPIGPWYSVGALIGRFLG